MWTKGIVLLVMTVVMTGWMQPWSTVAEGQAPICLVATMHGDVLGIDRGQSCEFRAVPFGLSTANEGRWKAPVAANPWAPAVLDATVPTPVCAQINPAGALAGTEDCLKLNIWAPHPTSGPALPVIVWLHGGSFLVTSAAVGQSNAERFVEANDVIVVAPNYRLGAFGFLGHSALRGESLGTAGNYGLLDQRLALEWVRTHISAFGGDP